MQELSVQKTIQLAKGGNERLREEFIKKHKPFIIKVSSNLCKRYLTWENDDELSIALAAFNEAIDKYEPGAGASFFAFAKTVITRRLIDYYRKESKFKMLSIDPFESDNNNCNIESDVSFDLYKEKEQNIDLADTVKNYVLVLDNYGISFEDLVRVSPKHRDSKEILYRAALALSKQPDLLQYLTKNKCLPLKELELLSGVKRKVLERGRKYLIATVLILTEPELVSLKSFTQFDSFIEKRG